MRNCVFIVAQQKSCQYVLHIYCPFDRSGHPQEKNSSNVTPEAKGNETPSGSPGSVQVNGQTTVDACHVIVPPVRSKKKIIPPPMDLTIVNTIDESNKEGSAVPAWDVSGICCLKCMLNVDCFLFFLIRSFFCLSIYH